ncbi:MAG: hypothetical protein DI629_03650 [Mesorhizobium amorphae]|nr:MAG: hypothetical protein DI629_03650 [Mesorhizobium amorphae]
MEIFAEQASQGKLRTAFGVCAIVTTTFAERLLLAMGSEKALPFAKRAGVPNSTLRSYTHEGKEPGLDNLVALARATSVNVAWLATGEGHMRLLSEPRQALQSQSQALASSEPAPEMARISRLDVEASAGGGLVPFDELEIGHADIPALFLRSIGVNPSYARILRVHGDSNEPTIRHGDTLLVDTSITQVLDERFYVVVLGGAVLVKRVQIDVPLNGITLHSDNKTYLPRPVASSELPDLHIAGRVAFYGRSI